MNWINSSAFINVLFGLSGLAWYISPGLLRKTLIEDWLLYSIFSLLPIGILLFAFSHKSFIDGLLKMKNGSKPPLFYKITLLLSPFLFVGIIPVAMALGLNYLIRQATPQLLPGKVISVSKMHTYRSKDYTSITILIEGHQRHLEFHIDELEVARTLKGKSLVFRVHEGCLGWKIITLAGRIESYAE